MPRQKQPIDLIVAKGNSHKTKEEIEARRDGEIHAPSDEINPPKYLTKAQKNRFKEIRDQLLRIGENGIIANIDAAALARYVISETQYENVTKKVTKLMAIDIYGKETEKLFGLQDKLFKQCRSAASDLGLTITSRCRIVIPKTEETKPNRFRAFEKNYAG